MTTFIQPEPRVPLAGVEVLYLGNADLVDSCEWVPPASRALSPPLPIYPRPADLPALDTSLARANGCDQPASARAHVPKTPAVQERVFHVVAANQESADTSARATAHRGPGGAIV